MGNPLYDKIAAKVKENRPVVSMVLPRCSRFIKSTIKAHRWYERETFDINNLRASGGGRDQRILMQERGRVRVLVKV